MDKLIELLTELLIIVIVVGGFWGFIEAWFLLCRLLRKR